MCVFRVHVFVGFSQCVDSTDLSPVKMTIVLTLKVTEKSASFDALPLLRMVSRCESFCMRDIKALASGGRLLEVYGSLRHYEATCYENSRVSAKGGAGFAE